jgi:hypothetical protein
LRGASAIEKLIDEHPDPQIRVLVVWEPVLATDVRAPATMTLKRISDGRVSQYWDKERLLSHAMGEHDRRTIVWDYVGIYEPGTVWEAAPPKAAFEDRPVVQVIGAARTALERLLAGNRHTSAARFVSEN